AKPVAGGLTEPAVTPKPPEAPASPDDQEAKAKRLMQLADNYVNAGLKSTAISKLKEIIKQYPDTKVAETAEEKLMKLER
ncbi:MAG: tetratricopeptide repeat protein, partial [Phycisphaerae bacterium]